MTVAHPEGLRDCANCGTQNVATDVHEINDLGSRMTRYMAGRQECPNGCDYEAQHEGLKRCTDCGALNIPTAKIPAPRAGVHYMSYLVTAQRCPNGC